MPTTHIERPLVIRANSNHHFERRLCQRNPVLGEASEGAVEASSD